jgi:hypothetical protein
MYSFSLRPFLPIVSEPFVLPNFSKSKDFETKPANPHAWYAKQIRPDEMKYSFVF